MKKTIVCSLTAMFLMLMFSIQSFAQKNKLEGIWYNEEKTAKVEIYKANDNTFAGKIVWLKEPNENGKEKLDAKNPDQKLKTRPLMGLHVLKGFKPKKENTYEGGTIYDPKNGKTYSCIITYKDDNRLDIRGYIGISLIGRTSHWTRTSL